MVRVHQTEDYDFYLQGAMGDRQALYNIVPRNSQAPEGGYHDQKFIEQKKGVQFPDRYQRLKNGMKHELFARWKNEHFTSQNNPERGFT